MSRPATRAVVHGDQRPEYPGKFYCVHCGLCRPPREFVLHLPIADHVEQFANTLQHVRVLGREPTAENIITERLFGGNEPTPEVARMYVALARRGEWP